MTTTAGATNGGNAPLLVAPRRHRAAARRPAAPFHVRRGVAVCLVLMALLVVDCLNLSQSTNWTDLRQGPHMAAIHQARHQTTQVGQVARERVAGTLPAPVAVFVAALFVLVALLPPRELGVRSRHGPPPRAPPTLRFA